MGDFLTPSDPPSVWTSYVYAPKTTVVFAADSRERSLRALLLQDALLRRGFDCLASEIRIEPASVRETEAEDFPNQEQIRWGGNLFRRFCNMFSENTLSLLGQHASCSTTAWGTLRNHFTKPLDQVAAPDCSFILCLPATPFTNLSGGMCKIEILLNLAEQTLW